MKKITKPGVYKGLSYSEYDAIPAMRSTYLKKHLHCPASTKIPDEETAALIFGIAAHVGVLEGMGELDKRYAFIPKFEGDKRTSQYKSLKQATIAAAEVTRKIVLDWDDYEAIDGIRKNCLLHPMAKQLIGKTPPEVTAVWKDESGLLMKARFDVSPYLELRAIVDLKTAQDAGERGFRRAIEKYNYKLSAAMYLQGASIVLKEKIDVFAMIAAEKEPPYKIEVHELDADLIEEGNEMLRMTVNKEVECRKSGFYPPWNCAGVITQSKYTGRGNQE